MSAIAASSLARQLEHLGLSDIEITSDACRTIYDSEVFPRLRWLRPKISEYRAEFGQRHETTDWVAALQQVFDPHPRAVINRVWRLKAEEYGRPRDTDVEWRHSVGPEEMTILRKRGTVTVWVMVRWTERQIVVYYFDAHTCSTRHYILPLTEDQLYLLRRATWPRSRPMPDVQEDLHGLNPLCDYFPWDWS